MTIDERLDKLTERHEALTQSVEMLLQTATIQERRMQRMERIQMSVLAGAGAFLQKLEEEDGEAEGSK